MDLTTEQNALVAAEEALRTGRHLLTTVLNQLLGGGYEPHPKSNVGKALAEMQAAETLVRNTLLKRNPS